MGIGGISLDIRVIKKEAFQVVGIPWNGTLAQREHIQRLFTEMEHRVDEVLCPAEDSVWIAPYHSRETEITYYVTIPVEKIVDVPNGMVGFTIPEKSYLFGNYRGSAADVNDTYINMFAWMREYGYEQDYQALCLEIYQQDFTHKDNKEDGLQVDIYLPIKQYVLSD